MSAKQRKTKDPQDKTVGVSVSRPKRLVEKFDDFIRQAAAELKMDLNHSQVLCVLEEMAMDDAEVRKRLLQRLKGH